MLEFENFRKSFWTGKQRKVILDRASFRVELGNSLGILAPNGTVFPYLCWHLPDVLVHRIDLEGASLLLSDLAVLRWRSTHEFTVLLM